MPPHPMLLASLTWLSPAHVGGGSGDSVPGMGAVALCIVGALAALLAVAVVCEWACSLRGLRQLRARHFHYHHYHYHHYYSHQSVFGSVGGVGAGGGGAQLLLAPQRAVRGALRRWAWRRRRLAWIATALPELQRQLRLRRQIDVLTIAACEPLPQPLTARVLAAVRSAGLSPCWGDDGGGSSSWREERSSSAGEAAGSSSSSGSSSGSGRSDGCCSALGSCLSYAALRRQVAMLQREQAWLQGWAGWLRCCVHDLKAASKED